jgi:hypothetical protein
MINELVDWQESKDNLYNRPYEVLLYKNDVLEGDFGTTHYFN